MSGFDPEKRFQNVRVNKPSEALREKLTASLSAGEWKKQPKALRFYFPLAATAAAILLVALALWPKSLAKAKDDVQQNLDDLRDRENLVICRYIGEKNGFGLLQPFGDKREALSLKPGQEYLGHKVFAVEENFIVFESRSHEKLILRMN